MLDVQYSVSDRTDKAQCLVCRPQSSMYAASYLILNLRTKYTNDTGSVHLRPTYIHTYPILPQPCLISLFSSLLVSSRLSIPQAHIPSHPPQYPPATIHLTSKQQYQPSFPPFHSHIVCTGTGVTRPEARILQGQNKRFCEGRERKGKDVCLLVAALLGCFLD